VNGPDLKSPVWLGSSLKDLKTFPDDVKGEIGHALFLAQTGSKSSLAKPLKGYGGAGVLEIVDDYDGDTYRAVYTVRFEEAIYVLHCFQKKSKTGAELPPKDQNLINSRLADATKLHQQFLQASKEKN